MARKQSPTGIRFPDDLKRKVEGLAEWLCKQGFTERPDFSAAIFFLLRRAEAQGDMNVPPDWFKPGV